MHCGYSLSTVAGCASWLFSLCTVLPQTRFKSFLVGECMSDCMHLVVVVETFVSQLCSKLTQARLSKQWNLKAPFSGHAVMALPLHAADCLISLCASHLFVTERCLCRLGGGCLHRLYNSGQEPRVLHTWSGPPCNCCCALTTDSGKNSRGKSVQHDPLVTRRCGICHGWAQRMTRLVVQSQQAQSNWGPASHVAATIQA